MIQGRLTDIYRGRVCTRTHATLWGQGDKQHMVFALKERKIEWGEAIHEPSFQCWRAFSA